MATIKKRGVAPTKKAAAERREAPQLDLPFIPLLPVRAHVDVAAAVARWLKEEQADDAEASGADRGEDDTEGDF